MDNKIERGLDTEISPGSSVPTVVMSPEERQVYFERLTRSIRATKACLNAIETSRKVLHKLSTPFREQASDRDSAKKISARNSRQRSAVFSVAKDVLDPGHPIKKSIEESLGMLDQLDDAIASNVRAVKEKILEKLDGLISHALKDTEHEQSTESIERFVQTAQDLNSEMDLRRGESIQLHKKFKKELRQAWINHLVTKRNMIIVAAILIVDAVASVGYMMITQEKPPTPDIVEPADTQPDAAAPPTAKPDIATPSAAKKENESQPKKVIPAQSEAASTPSATISTPATTDTHPSSNPSRQTATVSPQTPPPDSKARNGGLTLSSGQDHASMKKNVNALRDAIQAWNAENAAQGTKEKTSGKK